MKTEIIDNEIMLFAEKESDFKVLKNVFATGDIRIVPVIEGHTGNIRGIHIFALNFDGKKV